MDNHLRVYVVAHSGNLEIRRLKIYEEQGMEGRPMILTCERMGQTVDVLINYGYSIPCIDLTGSYVLRIFSTTWYMRFKVAIKLLRMLSQLV